MKELVLDVETTISNKGNPFDQTNKLCYVGVKASNWSNLYPIAYNDLPYGAQLRSIQEDIDQ